jgi:hypothetical protein
MRGVNPGFRVSIARFFTCGGALKNLEERAWLTDQTRKNLFDARVLGRSKVGDPRQSEIRAWANRTRDVIAVRPSKGRAARR